MEFPRYMVYFVWYLFWFLGAATAIFCFCFVFSRSFDGVECRRSPGRRFVLLLSWMHVFFLFERTGFFSSFVPIKDVSSSQEKKCLSSHWLSNKSETWPARRVLPASAD